MKSVSLFICLTLLFAAPTAAQERKDLAPDSLLNWLRIIETEGFKVVFASDDDGEFTAISVDDEGDLLIAKHLLKTKDKEVDRAKSGEEWSMHIVDVQSGKELWDETSKKQAPDSARITYASGNGIFTSSMTNAYPRGFLYALKPYDGRKVLYQVFRYLDNAKVTKRSYVLTLPERKKKR